MGTMIHHAIIVTSWDGGKMQLAKAKADLLFPNVLLSDRHTNNYTTLLIPPDGSKEGWPASNEGDERRNKFILWLEDMKVFDWVEVVYGECEPRVTRD